MLEAFLGAKESFGLECVFTERKKKKMHPVVRTAAFAGKSFLILIALLGAIWWTIFIYLLVAYGLFEGMAFAVGSIMFIILVCSMIYHDRP